MPAQLTRLGIDENRAILNIAYKVVILFKLKILLKTVLLGGSSVWKWTEVYDLTK